MPDALRHRQIRPSQLRHIPATDRNRTEWYHVLLPFLDLGEGLLSSNLELISHDHPYSEEVAGVSNSIWLKLRHCCRKVPFYVVWWHNGWGTGFGDQ